MRKDIRVDSLKRTTVLKYGIAFEKMEKHEEFCFDFTSMGRVEPFAMLVFASMLRCLRSKFEESTFSASNCESNQYAAHMGFFRSFGVSFGKAPGAAKGSRTYIPITDIEVDDLYNESKTCPIGKTIERRSYSMANVLSQSGNDILSNYLAYSLRELIRNVVEHSGAKQIWVAGQYWQSYGKVELAIVDEGIGIRAALRRNPHLSIDDDEQAILLACEPGVSGKAYGKKKTNEYDIWANSGFGLYMLSRICEIAGTFTLLSGTKAIVMAKGNYETYDAFFKGTAIGMTLYINRLEDTKKLLPRLVKEGELKARSNSKMSILRASKVSRMLISRDR